MPTPLARVLTLVGCLPEVRLENQKALHVQCSSRSLVYSNMNVSNFKTRNEYSMFAVNCCFCLWFYLRLGVSGILKLVVASSWQRCVVPWSEA